MQLTPLGRPCDRRAGSARLELRFFGGRLGGGRVFSGQSVAVFFELREGRLQDADASVRDFAFDFSGVVFVDPFFIEGGAGGAERSEERPSAVFERVAGEDSLDGG